jgi:hypothetical protein
MMPTTKHRKPANLTDAEFSELAAMAGCGQKRLYPAAKVPPPLGGGGSLLASKVG